MEVEKMKSKKTFSVYHFPLILKSVFLIFPRTEVVYYLGNYKTSIDLY